MEVQPDFRDLLALLNKHQVDYLIVGAYALAYHGAPRYTGDIDIYVRPNPESLAMCPCATSDVISTSPTSVRPVGRKTWRTSRRSVNNAEAERLHPAVLATPGG